MNTRLILVCTLALAISAESLACGESLYRVGKGVAYREYTAPLPGNLLVYSPTGNIESLADELGRAGHTVAIAKTVSDLVLLAERNEYQVVIGPYHQYEDFDSISVLSEATYLPIAVEGIDEDEAKTKFEYVMVPSKHEIKHYLKAIHKVLKAA